MGGKALLGCCHRARRPIGANLRFPFAGEEDAMTARFVLACLLTAFLPVVSHSQASTLTGRVLDPNRNALPRATVRLLDGRGVELDRALTDSQGGFQLAAP